LVGNGNKSRNKKGLTPKWVTMLTMVGNIRGWEPNEMFSLIQSLSIQIMVHPIGLFVGVGSFSKPCLLGKMKTW
jgi:hypothetical protein